MAATCRVGADDSSLSRLAGTARFIIIQISCSLNESIYPRYHFGRPLAPRGPDPAMPDAGARKRTRATSVQSRHLQLVALRLCKAPFRTAPNKLGKQAIADLFQVQVHRGPRSRISCGRLPR